MLYDIEYYIISCFILCGSFPSAWRPGFPKANTCRRDLPLGLSTYLGAGEANAWPQGLQVWIACREVGKCLARGEGYLTGEEGRAISLPRGWQARQRPTKESIGKGIDFSTPCWYCYAISMQVLDFLNSLRSVQVASLTSIARR